MHDTNFRNKIGSFIKRKWQMIWDSKPNKLCNAQPTVGEWLLGFRKIRLVEIILSKLQIRHTHCAHSQLFKNETYPSCNRSQVPHTIKYILISCHHITQTIQKNSFKTWNQTMSLISQRKWNFILKYGAIKTPKKNTENLLIYFENYKKERKKTY